MRPSIDLNVKMPMTCALDIYVSRNFRRPSQIFLMEATNSNNSPEGNNLFYDSRTIRSQFVDYKIVNTIV